MPTVPDFDERDRLRVVLVATRNPLNIGAAARAMRNFGFRHLRVVQPFERAFREAKSAVGAADILAAAQEYGSVAEAVADCVLVAGTAAADPRKVRGRVLAQSSLALALGAPVIREQLRSQPVALLFGSEKRGLSNESLSHCHLLLHIPTGTEQPSMNLGQSVAVCLYEIARKVEETPQAAPPPEAANAEEQERVSEVLAQVLRSVRYITPGAEAHAEERTRRFVRRLQLRPADARIALGMLRRIRWKLAHPESPPNRGPSPR